MKRLENSYQAKQILAQFFNLGLRLTKVVNEVKFEGIWGELEAKDVSRDNHS